jgi:RNA polymerase sigma factor (sigma-70 family)
MEVFLKAQFKNGLLWKAVQKVGTQKALADYLGVHQAVIGQWLNFHRSPAFRDPDSIYRGKYDEMDRKLILLIGYGLEEIFPLELQLNSADIKTAARYEAFMDLPMEQLAAAGAVPQLPPSPFEAVSKVEMRAVIDEVLAELTDREQQIIRMRFGLTESGERWSLEDIGQHLAVTRERVSQIEAKALRRLRKPTRSQRLQPFLLPQSTTYPDASR